MSIKEDKRRFSVCIASGDNRYYKHMDDKKTKQSIESYKIEDFCIDKPVLCTGKALIEAQRIANKEGKKVTVLVSMYNVYPDKLEK